MGSTLSPPAGDGPGALAGMRRGASSLVQGTMEVAVLVLVCLSPWLFGATGAEFEFLLYAGVAVLLGLWATRMLLDGELSWKNCPVAWCLAALALVAVAAGSLAARPSPSARAR